MVRQDHDEVAWSVLKGALSSKEHRALGHDMDEFCIRLCCCVLQVTVDVLVALR